MIKTFLNLAFFVFVSMAHSSPLFEGAGEKEDWLGTYFKGKKMGFTKSKTRWGPEGVVINSTVFFKIGSESADQSTSIKQTTQLGPDFRLSSFSLIQEIAGHRQQVNGKLEGNVLSYRIKSLGYEKEKTLKFTNKTAPSSTFLINLVSRGLKVGQHGKLKLFMESLQMLVDLEYKVLREEKLPYLENFIDTFVIRQRFSGMESTLWVAEDGTVFREITNVGFESFKEEPGVAQKLDGTMTLSSVIAMSLVKPNKPVPLPKNQQDLIYRIQPINSLEALPEDRRQKVLKLEKNDNGKYVATIRVKSEPKKLGLSSKGKKNNRTDPKYLEDTAEVQSNHKMIRRLAKELSIDRKTKWQLAKAINLWVHLNLEKEVVDTVTALDALLERRGECQSHTFLFTALARASGIPTRIVNGLVYSEEYEGFLYHAWPEVFVGEWRAMDPTLGQDNVDATHIKLDENSSENPFRLMEFVGKISISWRSL